MTESAGLENVLPTSTVAVKKEQSLGDAPGKPHLPFGGKKPPAATAESAQSSRSEELEEGVDVDSKDEDEDGHESPGESSPTQASGHRDSAQAAAAQDPTPGTDDEDPKPGVDDEDDDESEDVGKEQAVKEESVSARQMLLDRSNIDATKWSKEMNNLFIDLLIRESSENFYEKNENDWCRDSWARITRELELAFPLKAKVNKFDRTKLKKHLRILKDEHSYWRFIKDHARGFKWLTSKGSFSLDYYEVDHYFAVNKYVESEEVVKKYQRKKSWLKKFCVPHACDYIVKYDRYIFSKQVREKGGDESDSVEEDNKHGDHDDENDDESINEKELEIERKRRIFDDDDEDYDDDRARNGEDDGHERRTLAFEGQNGAANGTLLNDDAAGDDFVNVDKGPEKNALYKRGPHDDEDIDDDENELLELTGYGKPSPLKASSAKSASQIGKQNPSGLFKSTKKRKLSNAALFNGNARSYSPFNGSHIDSYNGFNDSNSSTIFSMNSKNFEKITRFVMGNVLLKKISPTSQQLLSRLLLHDLILYNFLLDEEFSENDKIKYINEVTRDAK